MIFLNIAMAIFVLLEISNVVMLYLKPETRRGNGMGVFKALEASRENPAVHALVRYLINWVAGTKLIFIVLLIGILIAGDATIKVFSMIALIFSISTFFSRLYPLIREQDESGAIEPKGYSRTLWTMIVGFIIIFIVALILYFILFLPR